MNHSEKKHRIFIVAGETSGDLLGAALIKAYQQLAPDAAEFIGVGGAEMKKLGFTSLFPMSDIAVNGLMPVIRHLPLLIRRIRETRAAVLREKPDLLLIIDSPDFTHRVAHHVRCKAPAIKIVQYVSPTVWAWRAGRAKKIAHFLDHLLALLPFEPEAHRQLQGPPCTYVGHPFIEKMDVLLPSKDEQFQRDACKNILLLPGSRSGEISHLMPIFKEVAARIAKTHPETDFFIPVVPHVAKKIEALIADWPVQPQLIYGEAAKFAAFRSASIALAASGTVTLELALARIPTIVTYKVSWAESQVKHFLTTKFAALPNIILQRALMPELIQEQATADILTKAVEALLTSPEQRAAQQQGFAEIAAIMGSDDVAPSMRAAIKLREVLLQA